MAVKLIEAKMTDAPSIAALRAAVADDLTSKFGQGHWSSPGSEKGVLSDLRNTNLFVVKKRARVIASLILATKKPWAIDVAYFTPCKKALYLLAMAVDPKLQRQGIGRSCMEQATKIVSDWPADAIRLDAYDAAAGASKFYRKCGMRETGRVVYRNVPLVYFELIVPQPRIQSASGM